MLCGYCGWKSDSPSGPSVRPVRARVEGSGAGIRSGRSILWRRARGRFRFRVCAAIRLGAHGRWAFAEFGDVYEMQSDFAQKVQAEFDRMLAGIQP